MMAQCQPGRHLRRYEEMSECLTVEVQDNYRWATSQKRRHSV